MKPSHPCSILIVLFLFTACAPLLPSCLRQSPTIAKVGSYTITQQDIDLQEQVLRLSYPQYQGDLKQAALKQLTDAFTFAEILKNNGHPITPETLKKESDRIDKTTLMPEALAKIKSIFGGDDKIYLKVYILPVYAGRVIYYEFFLHDKKVQAEPLAAAESFLQLALKSPQAFVDKKNKKIQFTVSRARGIEWKEEKVGRLKKAPPSEPPPTSAAPKEIQDKLKQDQQTQESAEGKRWIEEIISKLKAGGVHSQVIDQQTDYWVVRLVKVSVKDKDSFEMEAALFPKADYSKWLEAEKAKISRL